MSQRPLIPSLALSAVVALTVATFANAGGDQNAHNNPTGDPPTDTYQVPYANVGDGRLMIFCAEDELLVITPVESGAAEATCVPE